MTNEQLLVCPSTGQALRRTSARDLGSPWAARPRSAGSPAAIGLTDEVALREDGQAAYPVLSGVPVLLSPEVLLPHDGRDRAPFDLDAPAFAEAYAEMSFYNDSEVASDVLASAVAQLEGVAGSSFPHDSRWIDAPYDGNAQRDCYRAIGAVHGATALQIGGAGLHAVKFLLAGARRSVLVTPMITEALRARWLAQQVGVADRLVLALGVAEELPLAERSIDAAFTGGCLHHMVLELALPRIHRALVPGGTFGAAEPWRAPLYRLGTAALGKREAGTVCRPLTVDDVAAFANVFQSASITHHGALTRYLLLALSKAGFRPSASALTRWFERDDRWSDRLGVRRHGSSISFVGRAAGHPSPHPLA